MSIEVRKDWRGNLIVESDHGFGDIDHRKVYENSPKIERYMKESEKDRIGGEDYCSIRQEMESYKENKIREEQERYKKYMAETISKDYCW